MDNNIFPLPFNIHLAFVCIAFILFIFQFSRKKRTYQMIMAVAVCASLLLYLNSGITWHYCIGVCELVLFITAIVSVILDKRKAKAEKADEKQENSES